MNQKIWHRLGFILMFVFACNMPSSGSAPSADTSPVEPPVLEEPNSAPSAQANPIDDLPVKVTIPSENETPPTGILEQLGWGNTGGGGPDQDCGSCSVDVSNTTILLDDFFPSHRVRLFIYRNAGIDACDFNVAKFVTTVDVQTDENGSVRMPIDGATEDLFIAKVYDLTTGKDIYGTWEFSTYKDFKCTETFPTSCPGAPPQRLSIGSMAYVCTQLDSVKLRYGAGVDITVIKSIETGTELEVISGPKCSDNWSWWMVSTDSGETGWMSEGGDEVDEYFLCPLP